MFNFIKFANNNIYVLYIKGWINNMIMVYTDMNRSAIRHIENYNLTKEVFIERYNKIYSKFKKTLSQKTCKEKLYFSASDCMAVNYLFGSWNNFIKECGINPFKTPEQVKYSDEELLKMYYDFSIRLGYPAKVKDLDNSEVMCNYGVYKIRFGSMFHIRELLGFKSDKHPLKYTQKMIIKLLTEEYIKNGYNILSTEEIKANLNLPSITTICCYFMKTSMNEVWEEVINTNIKMKQ